jgi:carboxylate-amine ligase
MDQPLNVARRYQEVEEAMGWVARTQAIYGLHVHVAVPDGEAAIRAMNALARMVPVMISLSGNSPFWRGSDTRLSSTRIKVFEIFPRSGLPPTFHSWEAFERHIETLIASGSLPDYTWCWWDVRPHAKFGTVELRCLDAQTDPARTVSLAALTQCLVVQAVQEEGVKFENPLLTDENKWRAARYGMDAIYYDFDVGVEVGARDLVRDLVQRLRPISQDLRCEAELERILEIAVGDNGAEAQRAAFERSGSLEGVVDHLVDATA